MKLAFSFFPQFNPDPLNDSAWGKGFTDWDLVRRLPADIRSNFVPKQGFYDPSSIEYLNSLSEKLSGLSREAGLMLYHYYFDGQHVLPRVEEAFVRERLNIPFFLCWANESWTKRWVGKPNDILIEQKHKLDKSLIDRHVSYLLNIFDLPSYERHQGRPLFVVYNPHASVTLSSALELYREAFSRHGVHPFVGACLSYAQSSKNLTAYDFVCEFQPRFFFNGGCHAGISQAALSVKLKYPRLFELASLVRDRVRSKSRSINFQYCNYIEMLEDGRLEKMLHECSADLPLMRSVFLTWDNSPRYIKNKTVVLHDGVKLDSLVAAISKVRSDLDLPIFVNSWNEWSEGAALEPGEVDHAFRNDFIHALISACE